MTEKDLNVIRHIKQHCDRISSIVERFGNTFEDYSKDADYRDALNMYLAQIGELINKFSDEFVRESSEIDWKGVKGLRNVIVHDYSNVEPEAIWKIVINDVPKLCQYCDMVIDVSGRDKEE